MPSEEREAIPLTALQSDLHWQRIFDKYDKDNDGCIPYVEFKAIIESSEYDHELPDNLEDKIVKLADRDISGYLHVKEFVNMLQNPDQKDTFYSFIDNIVNLIIPDRQNVDTDITAVSFKERERLRLQCAGWLKEVKKKSMYEEEYACWPPPLFMITVSLMGILVFCYDAAEGQWAMTKAATNGTMAKLFIYAPNKRHEAWRFITYAFVHVNVVHLAIILLVQLCLGIPLEMVHRWWRICIVYFAGVAAGSLTTGLTQPTVYLAGAGGTYGLLTAHIATLIINWSHMQYALIQLLIFLAIIAVDVGTAVYNRFSSDRDQNIGYAAHMAGAFAGLLVGIGVLRNLDRKKWQKRLWLVAVVLYMLLMIGAILAHIFWTEHFII